MSATGYPNVYEYRPLAGRMRYIYRLGAAEARQRGEQGRPQGGPFPTPEEAAQAYQRHLQSPLAPPREMVDNPLAFRKVVGLYVRGPRDTSSYRQLWHMAEFFMDLPLNEITKARLEAYIDWRRTHNKVTTKKPVSMATINRDVHSRFRGLWRWACDPNGGALLPEGAVCPAKHLPIFEENYEPAELREDMIEPLFAQFKEGESRITIKLMYYLGVRHGQLIPKCTPAIRRNGGLQWEKVHLTTDRPHVSYTSAKGRKRGPRAFQIPIGKEAKVLFEALGPKPSGPVFPTMTREIMRRQLRTACRTLNIPQIRLHDLRGTFATILDRRGARLKTIRDALGHTTDAMAQRYIRSNWNDLAAAMDLL